MNYKPKKQRMEMRNALSLREKQELVLASAVIRVLFPSCLLLLEINPLSYFL